MKVKVSNIKWDATKEEAEECQLPNECILDVDEIEELLQEITKTVRAKKESKK